MATSDYYSGSALSGAGSGAATGAMVGSMVPGLGTGAGALIGGTLGYFGGASASSQRSDAVDQQKKSLESIMAQMRAQSAQSYSRYLAGLKKAQAFYAPAMQAWNDAYSQGTGVGDFKPAG